MDMVENGDRIEIYCLLVVDLKEICCKRVIE